MSVAEVLCFQTHGFQRLAQSAGLSRTQRLARQGEKLPRIVVFDGGADWGGEEG